MEYVAAGDVSAEGVHMLSTGGMLSYARAAEREARSNGREPAGEHPLAPAREAVVATETGMLYPLQMAAPDVRFIPANPEASCMYMKMITLPKLRDSLRHMRHEVRVGKEIATRARVPIDRMVAIG
jgi:quinolinate synthase